jgi:hypothetical protein
MKKKRSFKQEGWEKMKQTLHQEMPLKSTHAILTKKFRILALLFLGFTLLSIVYFYFPKPYESFSNSESSNVITKVNSFSSTIENLENRSDKAPFVFSEEPMQGPEPQLGLQEEDFIEEEKDRFVFSEEPMQVPESQVDLQEDKFIEAEKALDVRHPNSSLPSDNLLMEPKFNVHPGEGKVEDHEKQSMDSLDFAIVKEPSGKHFKSFSLSLRNDWLLGHQRLSFQPSIAFNFFPFGSNSTWTPYMGIGYAQLTIKKDYISRRIEFPSTPGGPALFTITDVAYIHSLREFSTEWGLSYTINPSLSVGLSVQPSFWQIRGNFLDKIQSFNGESSSSASTWIVNLNPVISYSFSQNFGLILTYVRNLNRFSSDKIFEENNGFNVNRFGLGLTFGF